MAFLEKPVWRQPDLARRCEVTPRTVRARIVDLQDAGMPIERDDDPPHVYWCVSPGWFPGSGGCLDRVDHVLVARLIARLPRTQRREQLLQKLIAPAFGPASIPNRATADVSDDVLDVFEDGAQRMTAVRMGYYSASRAEPGIRVISPQRIEYGTRTRIIAYCHTTRELRWIRADRATSPCLAPEITFMQIEPGRIDAFLANSLDGFASRGAAVACEFTVREKEAHWVLRNLPTGASAITTHTEAGTHVRMFTSALDVLARFLVGLGGAVRVVGPRELRARVRQLAQDALLASGARLNVRPARAIRSTK